RIPGSGTGMKSMLRVGALATSSSEPNRRMVVGVFSASLINSQPKLLAGMFSHDCTSLTSWAVDPNAYAPKPATARDADTTGENVPPGVVHGVPGANRLFHDASPALAGDP